MNHPQKQANLNMTHPIEENTALQSAGSTFPLKNRPGSRLFFADSLRLGPILAFSRGITARRLSDNMVRLCRLPSVGGH